LNLLRPLNLYCLEPRGGKATVLALGGKEATARLIPDRSKTRLSEP
jgi:hypothetical protein